MENIDIEDYVKHMHERFMAEAIRNPALGHPKYAVQDIVEFPLRDTIATGVIAIVDAYGTFEQNEEPSYDIFLKEKNVLVKHVRQSSITGKIGHADEIGWD